MSKAALIFLSLIFSVKAGIASAESAQKLVFDPKQNGVEVLTPELQYRLTKDGQLELSDQVYPLSAVGIELAEAKSAQGTHALLKWPKGLFGDGGTLRIDTVGGKELYKARIKENDVALTPEEETTSRVPPSARLLVYKLKTAELDSLDAKDGFRFCFHRESPDFKLELCSSVYQLTDRSQLARVPPLPEAMPRLAAHISVNGHQTTAEGAINLNGRNKKVSLEVVTESGETLKVTSLPIAPKLVDVVFNEGSNHVLLTGRGPAPQESTAIQIQADGSWQADLSSEKMELRFAGTGGIPFVYQFLPPLGEPKTLPQETDRPLLIDVKELNRTYRPQTEVLVNLRGATSAKADEGDTLEQVEGDLYSWRLNHLQAGATNRRSLQLNRKTANGDSRSYAGTYEVFRQFPGTVTILGGYSGASSSLMFVGQASAEYWFEHLGSWHHPRFSDQRWGVRVHHFQNANAAPPFEALSSTSLNFHYRWNPGVRDAGPSWGLMAGLERFNYNGAALSEPGAGVFASGPLPQALDRIFNLVPFFRYPKSISAEGIYYFGALDEARLVNPANFLLAAKGKMYFTPAFFMEAGVMYRSFTYSLPQASDSSTTSTYDGQIMIGSFGFGLNF